MTKRRAAWRSAVAGMLWATAWTIAVTLLAWAAGGSGRPRGAAAILGAGVFSVRPSEVGAWAATVLTGAGIAGALVGLLGRRIRARPLVRGLWIWLAFFPAVGLAAGVTFGVTGAVAEGRFATLFELFPAVVVLGTVLLAPALAIPLLLAAVTVERWTRPA